MKLKEKFWSNNKPKAHKVDIRDSHRSLQRTKPPPNDFGRPGSPSKNSVPLPISKDGPMFGPMHSPDPNDPHYPDLEHALRESEKPEYLGPKADAWKNDHRPARPRSVDFGTMGPHSTQYSKGSPERRFDDLRQQMRKMEDSHQQTLKNMDEWYKREKWQQDNTMRTLAEDLNKVKQQAYEQGQRDGAEIRRLNQELQSATGKAEEERRRMEQDHANKLQTVRDEASQKERRTAQEHADTIKTLDHEMKKLINATDAKERRLNSEHTQAINTLKSSHTRELSKQQQDHERTTQHIREEIAELNDAWLTRDDEIYQAMIFTTSGLPRKPDDKIKSVVLELQQMIDDLSRIEWHPNQDRMTERVLQRTGNQQHGQRALKKAIVQDIMWSLLFQWIFCSPFRMFGEEGKKLELEWNEQCGKGKSSGDDFFTWPSPGVKTERWRYMTMKECREILTKPIPSSIDKRADIKRGFKTNQDNLSKVLQIELENMLQLTAEANELLEKLAKKAAIVWLDFSMHRCRVVIRPSGTITRSTTEKMSAIQRGAVSLTVLPVVGRYGNVKGVELDRFTTIKGYEGSTLDIV